jgi:bacterioferritin-associated ferredoxin
MYVCSCRGVTERAVRTAISAGASCVEEIAARCGAGSRCGGCHPALERLLADAAPDVAGAPAAARVA